MRQVAIGRGYRCRARASNLRRKLTAKAAAAGSSWGKAFRTIVAEVEARHDPA
jgi:hypothetical protein